MDMTTKKMIWLKRVTLSVLVLLVGVAGMTIYLLKRPPLIYRNAQQVLAQTSEESRELLMSNVLTQLSDLTDESENIEPTGVPASSGLGPGRIDGFGRFSARDAPGAVSFVEPEDYIDRFVQMTLTNQELVIFVTESFVAWTVQRGYVIPGGVSDPVVIVHDGELAIAFNIMTPHWQQVFSGKLALTFSSDGMARGQAVGLRAGSLPIPIASVGKQLQMQLPDSQAETAERLGNWLSKLDDFEFRPVFEVDHRRRARVIAMQINGDSVTLKLRVQDHQTYKYHNYLLGKNVVAVTDKLPHVPGLQQDGSGIADVPTTTD